MSRFKELLHTGHPFVWKTDYGYVKAFSLADDKIPGVRHVYADSWHSEKTYSEKFAHFGIIIGDAVYDAYHTIKDICSEQGFMLGTLASEAQKLNRMVAESASQIVFDQARQRAVETVARAKEDLRRVKKSESGKGKDYLSIDYAKHDQSISKRVFENLHYDTRDRHSSNGIAYDAFYRGEAVSSNAGSLVKTGVTKRDVMKYLASERCKSVLDELVSAAVAEAVTELRKTGSYIVENLAALIIAEEIHANLVSDTQGEHYLIREICNCVNSEALGNAKTVSVTAEIEGETFTFNIDRSAFRREPSIYECGITPASVRNAIAAQLKKRCERENNWSSGKIYLRDILEITYKKKSVYKKGAKTNGQ